MPARRDMTWESGPRRWRKVYKGKLYTVSCRQLGTPGTQQASYQAANSWWAAKKLAIDVQAPPHPEARYLAVLARHRDWSIRHGRQDYAATIAREIRRIELGERPTWLEEVGRRAKAGYSIGGDPIFHEDDPRFCLEPYSPIWNDRIARESPAPLPEDQTVGGLIKEYLALREARVHAGDLGAKGHANMADCLHHFGDWLGAGTAIAVLDAKRWEGYWLYLNGKDWSRDYKALMFRMARQFVAWVGKRDLIAPPKNLHDRELRFGRADRAVPTMSIDDVRMLIERATGQLPLHLLLMANSGMTQQDVADLLQSEVDWDEGRITRRRSKTSDHDDAPIVSYPLWPLTFALLRQHRARSGDRALLTTKGNPWVSAAIVAGKLRSSDSIAANYNHLKKRLGFNKPLKLLRKTSASLLDEHPNHSRYVGHFLGHVPQSMQDRHYISRSREQFDAAVVWLGQKYGFVEAG